MTSESSHVLLHVRELLSSLVALSQLQNYDDVTIYCNDGVERMNRLVASLILPDLTAASHILQNKGEISLVVPDISCAQIDDLVGAFFGSVDNSLLQLSTAAADQQLSPLSDINRYHHQQQQHFRESPPQLGQFEDPQPQLTNNSSLQQLTGGQALEGIVECLDLTTNQLLYFQPSTVDKIITEEFIITNDELDDNCKDEDFQFECMSPSPTRDQVTTAAAASTAVAKPAPVDLSCQYCSKKFSRRFTLQRHIECQHVARSDANTYSACRVCQKSVRKDNYAAHALLHRDRSEYYPCPNCDRRFAQRAELNRHQQVHNTGGKALHTCQVCSKGFMNRVSFDYHTKTHREEDRRFTCHTCLKPFITRAKLTQHARCHTGEKTVKCNKCGSQFSRVDNLKHHLKKIHQIQLPDLRQFK